MSTPGINLEQVAAAQAREAVAQAQRQRMVDTLERVATKALGVLQEQGVYALMLYLYARPEREAPAARLLRAALFAAWQALPGGSPEVEALNGDTPALDALQVLEQTLLSDVRGLMLVRELFEQTLIYTRYAARAVKPSNQGSTGEVGHAPS